VIGARNVISSLFSHFGAISVEKVEKLFCVREKSESLLSKMDRAKRTRKADKKIAYAEDSSEDPAWEDDAPAASGGGGESKGKKRAKKTGKACGVFPTNLPELQGV